MRLLNTSDLSFKEFFEDDCPAYYILSHTWGRQETTFEYFRENNSKLSRAFRSSVTVDDVGVEKVFSFCDLAYNEGCQWVWVDTCCINKESSSELSEAINSMYKWYQNSHRCIVYLADVDGKSRRRDEQFAESRWFTRGWTLQELLAPRHCGFVDESWEKLGTKAALAPKIAEITGIDVDILLAKDPQDAILAEPISRRMLWASKRITTREEDTAYCLLGIFDVSMTMLYGEGSKAFYRLQRKLLKHYDDETLLAWQVDTESHDLVDERETRREACGLLAEHPSAFQYASWVMPSPRSELEASRPPMSLSNRGLAFSVFNRCLDEVEDGHEIILPLKCVEDDEQKIVGVPMYRVDGQWYRSTKHNSLCLMGKRFGGPALYDPKTVNWTTIYVQVAKPRGDRANKVASKTPSSQTIIRFSTQVVEPLSLVASLDPAQLKAVGKRHSKLSPEIAQVFDLAEIMYWTCRRKKITPEEYQHDKSVGYGVKTAATSLCRRMGMLDWEISDLDDSFSKTGWTSRQEDPPSATWGSKQSSHFDNGREPYVIGGFRGSPPRPRR